MSNFLFALTTLLTFSTSYGKLINCQCTQNPHDCELATFECQYQINTPTEVITRQSVIRLSGNENMSPEANIKFRVSVGQQTILDFGASVGSCDGQQGLLNTKSLLWKFNDQGTVAIIDQMAEQNLKITSSKAHKVQHQLQGLRIQGNCLMKKL